MATHTEKEIKYALNAIEEVANEENLFEYYKNLNLGDGGLGKSEE